MQVNIIAYNVKQHKLLLRKYYCQRVKTDQTEEGRQYNNTNSNYNNDNNNNNNNNNNILLHNIVNITV